MADYEPILAGPVRSQGLDAGTGIDITGNVISTTAISPIAWELFMTNTEAVLWDISPTPSYDDRLKWCAIGDTDFNNHESYADGVGYNPLGDYSVEILTPGTYMLTVETTSPTGGQGLRGPDDPLVMNVFVSRNTTDGDTGTAFAMYATAQFEFGAVSQVFTTTTHLSSADVAARPFLTVQFASYIEPTGFTPTNNNLDWGSNNGYRFMGARVG